MKKILQHDYTPIYGGRQVRISLDYEIKIAEDDPVALLCEEMERLDYTQLYEAYSRDGRSPAVSPKVMFMLLVFGYMNNIYSSREIVKACNYDVRFMYILNGEKVPSHSSICRFRSKLMICLINSFCALKAKAKYPAKTFSLMVRRLKLMQTDTHLFGKNQLKSIRKNY